MEKVEGGVEELVAGAHGEEDGARGVVKVHDGVAAGVHELVARSALKIQKVSGFFSNFARHGCRSYLHEGSVEVDPVAADVDDHAQLEEEGPRWVEGAERRQEGHGGAPVRQLIQHGPELGPLVEGARGVAVKSVQLR